MFRIILSTLGVSALMLSASSAATAHPHETVETQTKPSKKAEFKMPSEADIEDIIDKMPNINGIMGDLTDVLKDENLRTQLETTAKSFSESMKDSGAFETKGDELPDFNLAIETLLRSFADKDGIGGMLETMTDVAETMSESMEKHMPEGED